MYLTDSVASAKEMILVHRSNKKQAISDRTVMPVMTNIEVVTL